MGSTVEEPDTATVPDRPPPAEPGLEVSLLEEQAAATIARIEAARTNFL